MASPTRKASARRNVPLRDLALTTTALFIAASAIVSSPLANGMDAATSATPTGPVTAADSRRATTPTSDVTDARPVTEAPIHTVSGVLRDARTGSQLRDGCVGWRSTSALDTDRNMYTEVNESGGWSFASSSPGPFFLSFHVASEGDCANTIDDSYLPSWFENRAFAPGGADPDTALPPVGLTKVDGGTTGVVACLGTDRLPDACTVPDTTLSGRVVSGGSEPVPLACVIVFGRQGFLRGAITDRDGRWTIPDLPVDDAVIVGVLPPIDLGNGPCVFGEDALAPLGEGELQPEFYPDSWLDLSDPRLMTQAFDYGTGRGASVLTGSAVGVNVCLTTDPGDVMPRSSCSPRAGARSFDRRGTRSSRSQDATIASNAACGSERGGLFELRASTSAGCPGR